MAFSTPALANTKPLSRAAWLGLWLLLVAPNLQAADFVVRHVDIHLQQQVFLLNADIHYGFSSEALEALHNGVPLTIRIDIEIERPREWWWNISLASLQQGYRLQYHALSDQYLLQNLNSGAQYAFHSRAAALEALGRLRDFPLIDQQFLQAGEAYLLRLQARLDIEALPAPLRPIAYITPAWRLKSDWYQWPFTP